MHDGGPFASLRATIARMLMGSQRRAGSIILMYHGVVERITNQALDEYALDAPTFREHLGFLAKHRKVVPIDTLVNEVRSGRPPDPAWVVLTLDDALRNQARLAASILSDFKLPWSLSVPTALVNTDRCIWSYELAFLVHCAWRERQLVWPRSPHDSLSMRNTGERARVHGESRRRLFALSVPERMAILNELIDQCGRDYFTSRIHEYGGFTMATWNELQQVDRRLVQFVSHGVSHQPMTSLNGKAEWSTKVVESKRTLEQSLGVNVGGFAAPHGICPDGLVECLKDAGYSFGLTSESQPVTAQSDRYALPRFDAAYSLPVLRRFCLG